IDVARSGRPGARDPRARQGGRAPPGFAEAVGGKPSGLSGVLPSMCRLAAVAALCFGLLCGSAAARTDAVAVTPVVGGLDSPVSVRSAPGDPTTLYVVEQTGTIRIVRDGAVAGTFL